MEQRYKEVNENLKKMEHYFESSDEEENADLKKKIEEQDETNNLNKQ